jgi:hypothetical protein
MAIASIKTKAKNLLQKRRKVDEAKVRFDRKRDNYRRLKNDLLIRHLSNVAADNPIERKEVSAGKKKS